MSLPLLLPFLNLVLKLVGQRCKKEMILNIRCFHHVSCYCQEKVKKQDLTPGVPAGPFELLARWLGTLLGKLAMWLFENVWPFSTAFDHAEAIYKVGWKLRVWTDAIAALMLVAATVGENPEWSWGHSVFLKIPADVSPFVALGLGGIIGWFLPTIIGRLIQTVVVIIVLGIALGIVALGCWLIWELGRAVVETMQSRGG